VSGSTVTYTITANNAGPSTATASLLTDNFSSAFQSVSYTSQLTTGTASGFTSGTGDISDSLTLDPGSKVTYTVSAKLGSNTTGVVTNSVTIEAPANFTDTDGSNNSASVNVTAVPGADTGLVVTPNTPVASLGAKMS